MTRGIFIYNWLHQIFATNLGRLLFGISIGTFFYFLTMTSSPQGIIVLMYHRVKDNLKPDAMVVNTRAFRQQMQYLYNHKYKVIGISELVSELNRSTSLQVLNPKIQKRLNSETVLITFDDGYHSVYSNAYPILKEFGFSATIFLTTGVIEADKANPKYKNTPFLDMLSWENIREMAENGIEFGAHTINHPHLTQINIEEAKREIEESKKVVNELTGLPVMAFSYPYGEYNEAIKKLAEEAGFACAFTVERGRNREGVDLLELRRIAIDNDDSLSDFKKKITGGYGILHKLGQIRPDRVLRKLGTHLKWIKKLLS